MVVGKPEQRRRKESTHGTVEAGAEKVFSTAEGWAFRRAERPLPSPLAPLPLREKRDREAVGEGSALRRG